MSIRDAIEDVKSEALSKFVAELMTELIQQGFTFTQVLYALSSWSLGQVPDEYVRLLEEIAESVREVGR